MIVLLAGGTGGAKLARGLAQRIAPEGLTVIANTGDDFYRFGLRICPDVDSLLYLLSGKLDPDRGWGMARDTFQCLSQLEELGAETWFQIGDRDLAVHLVRHQLLLENRGLTAVTRELARRLGVSATILPMSEGYLPTFLETDQGTLHMQEYFVRERCRPRLGRIVPLAEDTAGISPPAKAALANATQIILGPSNPFISIGPILRTPGVTDEIQRSGSRVTAVSPVVGGRALKGPTAKMLQELGYPASVLGIAQVYAGLIDHLVIDRADQAFRSRLEGLGLEVSVMNTIMTSAEAEATLASELLNC